MDAENQNASLHITPEMLRLIGEVDEFKGAWRSLRALAPERLTALRRIATTEKGGSCTAYDARVRS